MAVILVATDFEEASLEAIRWAKELARFYGDEVVLMHAYQLPIYTYPGFEPTLLPGVHIEVTEAARRALAELAASQGSLRSILCEGDAAHAILETARELSPRLVALGTHGRKGLAHLLLGSVAERVIRSSRVPVFAVPTRKKEDRSGGS